MRNNLFRFQNTAFRMSTAAIVQGQAYDMVRQMALPLIPQRRVKGALDYISRDSGVPFSKIRKIYYRLTQNILHHEFKNIAAACRRAAEHQERLYRMEADRLALLKAEVAQWEAQSEFTLPMGSSRLPTTYHQVGDTPSDREAAEVPARS